MKFDISQLNYIASKKSEYRVEIEKYLKVLESAVEHVRTVEIVMRKTRTNSKSFSSLEFTSQVFKKE